MYDTIDDVRVAPLVETSWGQGVHLVQGAYNYYTPKHYVCGCVATGGARNVVIGNQCDIDFVPVRAQLRSVR